MTVTDRLPPDFGESNVDRPQSCDEAVTAEWNRCRLTTDPHLRTLPESCREEVARALADFEVLLRHACSPQTVEYHQFLKENQHYHVPVDGHDIAFGGHACGSSGEICNPCRCTRDPEILETIEKEN
jgi:hypothetical protein